MSSRRLIAWLPLVLLPGLAVLLTPTAWPRWAFMWVVAGSLYAGCKWLTWLDALPTAAPWRRQLGYLLAWPGMDAASFLHGSTPKRPVAGDWFFAFAKLLLGVSLMWGVMPLLPAGADLARGWVGMVAIVFLLHFGVFDLLHLGWRWLGVDARPVQNWPVLSRSVSEFWGQRWNTAFRDLTHRYLFRPLTARLGGRMAVLVGFLVSGLVHDLVISVPAGAGYGLPTLFFLIQALAVFLERSAVGRRLGLGSGVRGWAFTMLTLLAPVALLFHPPFVREVVVPFIEALT